ncbi:hypothetical protein ZWY2020_010447 [Hordeum vulgare]|nr:hypothetical protein ZWY2020_010447 [Hordeum vulgare]
MATKAPPTRWNTKRYILMALLGTLVGSGVVIAVSAILCPAVIVFSVTGSRADVKGGRLSLTLDVNDTSLRTGVQFRSVIVYLQYADAASAMPFKVPADVDGPNPSPQLPGTTAKMMAAANFAGSPFAHAGADGGPPNISVLVLAVVRFNVGPWHTRPYDVRVLCAAADYFRGNTSLPIACV